MIVLKSSEATSLSFEMDIDGPATKVESVCLNIETGKGFDLRIPAKFENKIVESTIPVIDYILESGEYTMSLEVVVDGKLYQPLQESIKIETPVQIVARVSESVEIVEEKKTEPVFKTMSLSQAILKEAKQTKQ